jgi:hypothetical protein
MQNRTKKQLKRIEERYNADRDMIPNGPAVTWAERALLEAVRDLEVEVKELRAEIEELRQKQESAHELALTFASEYEETGNPAALEDAARWAARAEGRSDPEGGKPMNREQIMDELNADDWSTVVAEFDGLDTDAIEAELDAMFPTEDNDDLALATEAALEETRVCILATEDNGTYEIHPNATPEAWVDVVAQREISEAIPIEELHGWGRWRWAYRLQRGPEALTYFVDATPDAIEGP